MKGKSFGKKGKFVRKGPPKGFPSGKVGNSGLGFGKKGKGLATGFHTADYGGGYGGFVPGYRSGTGLVPKGILPWGKGKAIYPC